MKPKDFLPKVSEATWQRMDARERALHIAADICDRIQAHEEGGNNKGEWPRRFLHSVGLNEGYAWCAALQEFCNQKAGLELGPALPAAVRNWAAWAAATGRLTDHPERGDLFFYLNNDQTGHMGRVVRKVGPWVWTIEGNTSSGEAGSQRDGDGVYRRTRLAKKLKFISLAGNA